MVREHVGEASGRVVSAVKRSLSTLGYELRRVDPLRHADVSQDARVTFARVESYTQTSFERVCGWTLPSST